jgi:hypothetical protein
MAPKCLPRIPFLFFLFSLYLNAACSGLGIGLLVVEMEHRVFPLYARYAITLMLLIVVTYPIAFQSELDCGLSEETENSDTDYKDIESSCPDEKRLPLKSLA